MRMKLFTLAYLLMLLSPVLNADTKFLSFISQVKGFNVNQIHYYEQFLFVSNDFNVQVYSLSNPWSPHLESGFQSSTPITDIINLEANRFYVCSPDPTIRITEIDSFNTYGRIFFADKMTCLKADREGALLYTSDSNRGLEIYNLGNGLTPSKLCTFSEKWGIRDFVAKYPRIHALNDFGYVNLDIENTSNPVSGGKNYEVVDGSILCINNGYAWIGAGSTLVAMDITDVSNPVIISRHRFNDRITALVAKESELFVGLENSGLKIMDISNPYQVFNTHSYFVDEGVRDISLNAEYIYLAAGRLGWIILRYL